MKNKILKRITVLMLIAVMVICFSGCTNLIYQALYGDSPILTENNEIAEYLLSASLAYISQEYVNELTDDQILEAAIVGANTIMGYYDNYGYMFTPAQYYSAFYETATVSSHIFGFSFSQLKYCGLLVTEIVVDSNAYKADLFAKDVIVDVLKPDGSPVTYEEGEETKTLHVKTADFSKITEVLAELDEIQVKVLRGGSEELCYEDGEEITINLTRGRVSNDNQTASNKMEFIEYYVSANVCNVSSKTIELRSLNQLDGTRVGYICIKEFGKEYDSDGITVTASSMQEFKNALDLLEEKGCTKVIIDVQNNPGGYVDEVAGIAQYLIYDDSYSSSEKLPVTTLIDRDGAETTTEVSSKYNEFFINRTDMSIVILTNENSASGSELLTGVLLDYGTAVQVGSTTYGKGIAQRPVVLSDIGSYQIAVSDTETVSSYYCAYFTFAYYYSPKTNTNIHGVGYTPDEDNIITDYESQLERALDIFGVE